MLYLLIIIYLMVLIYFFDCNKIKSRYRNVHYNILLIVFVLVSGLRYRMAPDSVAYMDNFKNLIVPLSELNVKTFTESRYQPFWILINSFCKSFGSYVLLQIICAYILNFCVFHFFKKTTTKVFTCILFYFLVDYFYFNMEIVRESLAIGVFLLAMIEYNKKKILNTYLLILVAFLFHHFAAILFIIPLFLTNKISLKLKLIFLSSIILFLFSLGSPLALIEPYLGSFSTLDVSVYDLADFNISLFGYIYTAIKIIPIIAVILIYRKRDIPDINFEKKTLYILSFLYIFIMIIRITTIPFIERFSNYFIFFVILLLAGAIFDIVNKYIIKSFRFFSILTVSTLCFLFQIFPYLEINPMFGVPLYKRYYPYYSVISEKTDPEREFITEMESKE